MPLLAPIAIAGADASVLARHARDGNSREHGAMSSRLRQIQLHTPSKFVAATPPRRAGSCVPSRLSPGGASKCQISIVISR
jgi:hypothetical protein